MNAGCMAEPLAERSGEISVIAIPASVGYFAQRLAGLHRGPTLDAARGLVQAQRLDVAGAGTTAVREQCLEVT